MILVEKTENKIKKPTLHTTLQVLHNLWSDGHLNIIKLDEILRKDYGHILQHMEQDFMHVEALDGLSNSSIGDGSKYKINPEL
jgi:hypothetical protein